MKSVAEKKLFKSCTKFRIGLLLENILKLFLPPRWHTASQLCLQNLRRDQIWQQTGKHLQTSKSCQGHCHLEQYIPKYIENSGDKITQKPLATSQKRFGILLSIIKKNCCHLKIHAGKLYRRTLILRLESWKAPKPNENA